jgi:hypothetical protein
MPVYYSDIIYDITMSQVDNPEKDLPDSEDEDPPEECIFFLLQFQVCLLGCLAQEELPVHHDQILII